jgi:hypothetical protein
MKRNIPLVLVLLFTVSATGLAQQPTSAEAVYNNWRQGSSADVASKLRFALASVTRRTGDEVAEIDLWAVGRASEATFEIQPLYVEKLPNGEYRQEQAGAITRTTVTSSGSGGDALGTFGLKVVAPVGPSANAFEIKWVGDAAGKRQVALTTQVWLLRDEPSESLTRITTN